MSGPGNFGTSLMCVAPQKFVVILLLLKAVSCKCERVLHKTGIFCSPSLSSPSPQLYWSFSIYIAIGWVLPCTFCELDSFPFTYPWYCYYGKATNIFSRKVQGMMNIVWICCISVENLLCLHFVNKVLHTVLSLTFFELL